MVKMNKYTKRAQEYWEETHKHADYTFLFDDLITSTYPTNTISFSPDTVVWTNES